MRREPACGQRARIEEPVAAGDVVQEVRRRRQRLQVPALRARAAGRRHREALCELRQGAMSRVDVGSMGSTSSPLT